MMILPSGVKNIAKHLPYAERLRNYERDKQTLLSTMSNLPAKEFAEKLKALQEKWDV